MKRYLYLMTFAGLTMEYTVGMDDHAKKEDSGVAQKVHEQPQPDQSHTQRITPSEPTPIKPSRLPKQRFNHSSSHDLNPKLPAAKVAASLKSPPQKSPAK